MSCVERSSLLPGWYGISELFGTNISLRLFSLGKNNVSHNCSWMTMSWSSQNYFILWEYSSVFLMLYLKLQYPYLLWTSTYDLQTKFIPITFRNKGPGLFRLCSCRPQELWTWLTCKDLWSVWDNGLKISGGLATLATVSLVQFARDSNVSC